jgi:tryptophan synthase alpha chain
MSDIAAAFDHGKAFVAFVTAGDPTLDASYDNILALIDGGADLIEIGVPFSDPIAEGPVIQAANVRALSAGATIDGVFALAARVKAARPAVPLVLLTYLNPVFHLRYERFCARCAESGVAGLVIPDLPFEEQGELKPIATAHGVDVITLVAPTSAERVRRIAGDAAGFVYLVSSLGVTGMRSRITTDLGAMAALIREASDVPVAVGFGVTTPEQAAEIAAVADGVIVGSKIVSLVAEFGLDAPEHLRDYARSIKAAIA